MRFDLADSHRMENLMPTVLRNVRELDKLEGICAFHTLMPWDFRTFSNALVDPSKFVGIGGVPDSGELGVFAQLSVL